MKRWRNFAGSRSAINISFAAAFAVVVFVGFTLFRAYDEARIAARSVAHTLEVLRAINGTRESHARLDAAQRGYLLTGAAHFLEERDTVAAAIHAGTSRIAALTRDDPALQARNREMVELVRQHLDAAVESSQLRARYGLAAIAAAQVEGPQRLSERVQAVSSEMLRAERGRLASQQAIELDRQRQTAWLVSAAFVLFLLVLVPSYFGLVHQWRRRRRTESQMTELVEQLPATVWQFRSDARESRNFLYVGSRAARDRGLAAKDLLRSGDGLFANVVQEDHALLHAAMARAEQSREPFQCEYRVAMPDGGIKWVRSAATLRPQPDGAVVWTGYWADITAQKELELALQAATDEANRANRAKGTFLATMSHEIRTPMNGVLGLLELLSLTRLDAEQRATLDVVSESGRALLRIIDDILDFSKVEAGRLALNPVPASVHEVVDRALQIHSGTASSHGLLLQKSVDPHVSDALIFDPLRLGQILNNFISNALKFTTQGSVTLSVESLSRSEEAEKLRFVVADTGIGLSPEAAKGLFQPFAQADAGTAARFGGTGLGLAICKRLAEMMNGGVSISSEEGKGTRVMLEVTFPVASVADLEDGSSVEGSARQVTRALASRRLAPSLPDAEAEGRLVLVVDDHPTNRLVLSRQVAALGYGLLTAEDGAQALELWRTRRIGLVLTDCNMPELNGYDLARAIRASEAKEGRPRTPVVACTANALGQEAARCLAAGMDDFLVKPVNLVELMERLDQWLPLPTQPDPSRPASLDAAVLMDSAALNAITGGDPAVQREVLLDFRHVNDADVQVLRAETLKGDAEQVLHMAHRIKGAARTIGAHRLTLSCERLEDAVRTGEMDEAREELAQLEQEVGLLNLHIDQFTTSVARSRETAPAK